MPENIYLPPKGANWNEPNSLGEESDITNYSDNFGNMNILNEEEIEDAIYPPIDDSEEYHHKDGKFRHPESLYLIPGNPKHRSDSLNRS